MEYNFDYLKNLYVDDPAEFKRVTSTMVDDIIKTFPADKQQQYRSKQWRLEQDLNRLKNPIARMNKMITLFWTGVNDFTYILQNINSLSKYNCINNNNISQVIDFKSNPKVK